MNSSKIHQQAKWLILEAVAGDQQVRFCHPEDVVDGSGCQDLPHGLRDDVC